MFGSLKMAVGFFAGLAQALTGFGGGMSPTTWVSSESWHDSSWDDTWWYHRNPSEGLFLGLPHCSKWGSYIFLQLKGLLIRNWTFRSERYRKKGHWFHCNYYISRGCHAMIHYGIVAVAPALFEPEAGVPLVASLCSRLSKDVGYGSKLGTWIIGWLGLKIDKSICGLPSF